VALRFDMGNPNWQAMAMQQQSGATASQLGSDLASLGGILGKTLNRKLGPAQRAFDAENKRRRAAGEDILTTEKYGAFKDKFRADKKSGRQDKRLLRRAKRLGLDETFRNLNQGEGGTPISENTQREQNILMGRDPDDDGMGGGVDDPTALTDEEVAAEEAPGTLLQWLKTDEGQKAFGAAKTYKGQERANKFGTALGAPFALAGGMIEKATNPIMDIVNKAKDKAQTRSNLREANRESRGGLDSFNNFVPKPTQEVPQFTGNFGAGGGSYHNAPQPNLGLLNKLMNINQQVPNPNIGMMRNQAAIDRVNLSNQHVNNPPIMTNQFGLPITDEVSQRVYDWRNN
tara:strand:+ start:558 stop:1589 length:1032 start_codon:yes stop_codon:yes gene_type:complete